MQQDTTTMIANNDLEITYEKNKTMMVTNTTKKRPKILALCGALSNNYVTKLQLQHLGITEENYDIMYVQGPIEVEEGDPELIGLVYGPFYSWLATDKDNNDDDEASPSNRIDNATRRSLLKAISYVLGIVKHHGPFDGIYGFSSGGLIATLVVGIADDAVLQKAILEMENLTTNNTNTDSIQISDSDSPPTWGKRSTMSTFLDESCREWSDSFSDTSNNDDQHGDIPTIRPLPYSSYVINTANFLRNTVVPTLTGENPLPSATMAATLESQDLHKVPFQFVILACSAFSAQDITSIRNTIKFGTISNDTVEDGITTNMVNTRSFHIIGAEDPFRVKSEEIASLFKYKQVKYLPTGHSIGREAALDNDMCLSLKKFVESLGSPIGESKHPMIKYVSDVTSIFVHPEEQIVQVQLDRSMLPEGMYEKDGGATIMTLLQAQPREKSFLYVARDPDSTHNSTYGDIIDFIQGGAGDLRRLGVKPGEVVVYGTPPGGSPVAALAFLSIGAQTAAAPLAPGMTEPDVLDALDQFHAKHLVLFEGVDCPGVEAAFLEFIKDGKAQLHRAKAIGNERPGIFEYIDTKLDEGSATKVQPLKNPTDGVCLLLRTSGTTARPKGVPLKQGALVTNGAIIAKSMRLEESDVCYSVMPLFHIGGISASILSMLAAGGAVCCDSEPFEPSRMVDALALSNPQPTWYSSVPTIHNATVAFLRDEASKDVKYKAYGIDKKGRWRIGHSLRMIRSGAAALLGPDGEALSAAYGDIPIFPTYSMSEQMPISQPPAGKTDMLASKPGSVGVPVAASIAIVNRSTLRVQPRGAEGEIAICGPTVMDHYLDNPEADAKSYFYLTIPDGEDCKEMKTQKYFLTGDVGVLDEEGFLSLKGRAKELIKKGGEQVSPFEVEEPLLEHPWVQTSVCFSVPSKLYGEEVGCSLVLSPNAPKGVEEREVIKEMRKWLKQAKLAPIKWPTKWVICQESALPRTKSQKYIRIGLSQVFGLESEDDKEEQPVATDKDTKAKIDWGVITGFRFCLTCYVIFMHFGSNESWGAINNLRGFPWHMHAFFTLGGFSLASPMNPAIKAKFSYFKARVSGMYPMYAAALILSLSNLLIVCRPSTFRPNFHWDSQPDDLHLENGELAPLFCEGTPVTPTSYWGSLSLTILVHIFGLAVTPFWPMSWWMGYYLWFNSMYYQCLAIFPAMYNWLFNARKQKKFLLGLTIGLLVVNAIVVTVGWLLIEDYGEGYNHYDVVTGERNSVEDYKDDPRNNIAVLSFYLFGPFWVIYFAIGACTAFLYDAYRPAERHSAWVWGIVADTITFIMIVLSVLHIAQGVSTYGEPAVPQFMRPSGADEFTDISSLNRLWSSLAGRIMAPLTTLWVFAMSTGQGYTAAFMRNDFLSKTLGPNSYNCFLFQQMVGQWYFAATRNRHMWNWWRYRKDFYWFSPEPCPIEWYEYFIVVGLSVAFSRLMDNKMMPFATWCISRAQEILTFQKDSIDNGKDEEEDIAKIICDMIEKMTGIEPDIDSTLEECGLASVGIPVLVRLLNKTFSDKDKVLWLTTNDVVEAKTIEDMVKVVEAAKGLADEQGV